MGEKIPAERTMALKATVCFHELATIMKELGFLHFPPKLSASTELGSVL